MLYICRTSDKHAKAPGDKHVIDKKHPLFPSEALRKEMTKLKRQKVWSEFEPAFTIWQGKYLEYIANTPEARTCLNVIFKQARTQDVVVAVSENSRWALSIRRIIIGLMLGAGVSENQISAGNEIKPEELMELKGLYNVYKICANPSPKN